MAIAGGNPLKSFNYANNNNFVAFVAQEPIRLQDINYFSIISSSFENPVLERNILDSSTRIFGNEVSFLFYLFAAKILHQSNDNPNIVLQNYFQYLSSFSRFFGENSKQDASKIYIAKSDLPKLSSFQNNTAESLFVALVLRQMIYESNSLISKVYIWHFKADFITRGNNNFINNVLVIQLFLLLIKQNYEYTNYSLPHTANTYQ